MPAPIENPVKRRLADGQLALGMSVRLGRSPDIARIAKATRHDFLFIDTQHSVFDLETIASIAQTAMSIGVAPLVRVRSVEDPDAALLLDNGVSGLVFPDVETAEQAERAVQRVRFPPLGHRSVAGAYPQFDFAPVPQAQAVEQLQASTLLVCMVESPAGVANIEAIAAVPGVDVVHIGTHDLLSSLGKPGQFDAPEVLDAYRRAIDATRAHGTHAGVGGNRDVERQVAAVEMGMRFLTTHTDIGFLVGAATKWTADLRTKTADVTSP